MSWSEFIKWIRNHEGWNLTREWGHEVIYYEDDTWRIVYEGNVKGFYQFTCYLAKNKAVNKQINFISAFSDDPDWISKRLFETLNAWLERKEAL